jgi:hypothetical protein
MEDRRGIFRRAWWATAASERCREDWRTDLGWPGESGSTKRLLSESIWRFTLTGVGIWRLLVEAVEEVVVVVVVDVSEIFAFRSDLDDLGVDIDIERGGAGEDDGANV